MLMSWLRRKPLSLLKEIVVLYDNDKIRIYSNNNMHKEGKKNQKIYLEQLHLSIKGNNSINPQRFFCAVSSGRMTTQSGTYSHV